MTNPTPKARFLQAPNNISEHREMVDSNAFQRGVDFALLEYNRLIALDVKDGNSAMAAGLKVQGAFEFVQTLRLLSEQAKAPEPLHTRQLNHNV